MSHPGGLNEDFRDFLDALTNADVEYVVIGAHALAGHGFARFTEDLDVLVRPTMENAQRLMTALQAFGAPLKTNAVTALDFTAEGTLYQMGLPPRRIDIATVIHGLTFEEAWRTRVDVEVEGRILPMLGLDAIVRNKRATGRPLDLADLALLEEAGIEVSGAWARIERPG